MHVFWYFLILQPMDLWFSKREKEEKRRKSRRRLLLVFGVCGGRGERWETVLVTIA